MPFIYNILNITQKQLTERIKKVKFMLLALLKMENDKYTDERRAAIAHSLEALGFEFNFQHTLFLKKPEGLTINIEAYPGLVTTRMRRAVILADFYLPEFSTAIECLDIPDYFNDDRNSGSREQRMRSVYELNYINYIAVPPTQPYSATLYEPLPQKEYRKFITSSIQEFLTDRLNSFRRKSGILS